MSSSFHILRERKDVINAELEHLALKTHALEIELDEIVTALSATMFDVASLPPDVLGEIFTFYLDSGPIVQKPRYPYNSGPTLSNPLILASVCSPWRNTALSLPALWTSLEIHTHKANENMQSLLNTSLPRAKTLPLNLDIRSLDATGDVLSKLIPYSNQWGALSCRVIRGTKSAGNIARGKVPKLRKIDVVLYNSMDLTCTNENPPKIIAFADAPLLREVNLSGIPPARINLPWMQLTKLQLSKLDDKNIVHMLRLASNLRHLDLTLHQNTVTTAPTGKLPLCLPCVQTLTLRTSTHSAFDFLRYLTTPSLTTVEFIDNAPEAIILASFFSRSECSVTDVVFAGEISAETAATTLAVLVHTVRLEIKDVVDWTTPHLKFMLRIIAIDTKAAGWVGGCETEFCVLPELESLIINPLLHGPDGSIAVAVAELLEKSRKAGRPLKELEVMVRPRSCAGVVQRREMNKALEVLKREGLGDGIRLRNECSLQQTTSAVSTLQAIPSR
ncbi:hypothetical protein MKEN_00312000 [Mycena kentingensis (nom. inval.)]|nr:hypothetical protein MKEN_00312000 [Mycena kentingensis (nom. inval.)]